jgi:hypothetical protein
MISMEYVEYDVSQIDSSYLSPGGCQQKCSG